MDSLSELIAAGELVIAKSKERLLKHELSSTESCSSKMLNETSSVSIKKAMANGSDQKSDKLSFIERKSLDNEEEDNNSCLESRSSSTTVDKNPSEKFSGVNVESSFHSRSSTSNGSDDHSSVETFSQLHIQKLKEECALIFSLGHTMASSLINANRILHQLVSNDSRKTSDAEESLLSEISSCNDSCKENEDELQSSSYRIQNLLALISESYFRSKEQEENLSHIRKQAVDLLTYTKELLAKQSLGHLVTDVDENRSPSRVMEEVKLGLTLLLGELPSRLLHQQTIELQESQNYQKRLEKKFDGLEKEFRKCNEEKTRKLVQIEIELERKLKDLEEAATEITDLQKDRESAEEKFQEELKETEKKRLSIIEELVKIKEFNNELKTNGASEREQHDFLRSKLEEEISVLKSRIRTFEENRNSIENESEKTCKDCEGLQKLLASEMSEYRSKLLKIDLEKQTLIDQVRVLEGDIEKRNILNESLKADIEALIETAHRKSEEYAADLLHLERKLDVKNEELCERDSEVRQNEVIIMELKADLGLERQRSCSLSAEIDMLQKQVDGLGTKMKKIIGFCPREVRINCGLSHFKGIDETELDSKLSKYLEESHQRETDLKTLLEEKDEELKELRQSLGDQIAQKNEELEKLTNSIENLEEEMSQINSSLNLSAELFSASCQTSSYLDSRAKHLEAIQEQVNKTLLTSRCMSCEANSEALEDLKGELSEAKKATRAAREEARAERIEAAKIKQQMAMLQIDLESARELAKYHTDKIPILSMSSELRNTSSGKQEIPSIEITKIL